jgi:sugar phosphate isomerase/epimerase
MIELATMTSVCPDWDLDKIIAGMKRHGYKGLEPRVEWGHACGIEVDLSAEQRSAIKTHLADEGLNICCIATGVRMAAPDVDERAGHVEDLRKYIDLAADLGCGFVRTFGGQRARDREWQLVVDYVVDGYEQVMGQAAERGVVVLMETHDDWSCSAPVRAVVEQAEHPNLKVLWDFMHPQRMLEKPEESFAALADHTRHLHAHDGTYVDGRMQVGPLGTGVIDHQIPLQLLLEAGFAGYLSVEVIHKPGSEHDADGVLRQYAEQFAKIMAEI